MNELQRLSIAQDIDGQKSDSSTSSSRRSSTGGFAPQHINVRFQALPDVSFARREHNAYRVHKHYQNLFT